MGLLFEKYASPFSLIDVMIEQGRFLDFILEFFESKLENELWEIWLHKVYDKSFEDFKEDAIHKIESPKVAKRQVEATVKESLNILDGFKPT